MTPHIPIPPSGLGHQFVGDIYDCQANIADPDFIKQITLDAAKLGNATVLKEVTHEFSPHGLSCVLVIAESHMAVHTWPEHGYVSVDLFTCDLSVKGQFILEFLKSKLQSERATLQHVRRGLPSPCLANSH